MLSLSHDSLKVASLQPNGGRSGISSSTPGYLVISTLKLVTPNNKFLTASFNEPYLLILPFHKGPLFTKDSSTPSVGIFVTLTLQSPGL